MIITGRRLTSLKTGKDDQMTLGELLGMAREIKGWTLRDLERETGVSNALISQIETGHVREPGFFTVIRIAQALGLPLARIAAADRPTRHARPKDEARAKGGHARAESLSPERRKEIARAAAKSRWEREASDV